MVGLINQLDIDISYGTQTPEGILSKCRKINRRFEYSVFKNFRTTLPPFPPPDHQEPDLRSVTWGERTQTGVFLFDIIQRLLVVTINVRFLTILMICLLFF